MGEFIESVSITSWVIFVVLVVLIIMSMSSLKNTDCDDLGLSESECCNVKGYAGFIFTILFFVFIYWMGSQDGRNYMKRK